LQTGRVTASQGTRDIIRRWLQRAQLGIDFRVVVQSTAQLPDEAAVPVTHQCEIDRPAGTEIQETIGRKDPTPLAGLYPPEDPAARTVCVPAHIFERK